MFKLKTSEGTLIVEVNQPDASVEISTTITKWRSLVRVRREPLTIAVDPGKHRLKVTKDGYEFLPKELKSGGKVVVKATLVPLKVAVTPVPTIPSCSSNDGHNPGCYKTSGRSRKSRCGMGIICWW